MIALGSFAAGAVVSVLIWSGTRGAFRSADVLRRSNYRGVAVPVAAGLVIAVAALVVELAFSIWTSADGTGPAELARDTDAFLAGVFGFALLGLFDDLAGAGEIKGFRGHLRALRDGVVTSGMLKLCGGVALGIVLAPGDLVESLRGGLLIAASANLANLFDRSPGRVVKVSLLGAVLVVVVAGTGWPAVPTMVVVGAGVGLLRADLREECMLGDTGANVLGAAVGFGLVVGLGPIGEWSALAVVVAMNLMSERVSFSAVIDATPPLRWIDRLGTRPERRSRPS